jgi:sugar phosphate isomerase/epimerase
LQNGQQRQQLLELCHALKVLLDLCLRHVVRLVLVVECRVNFAEPNLGAGLDDESLEVVPFRDFSYRSVGESESEVSRFTRIASNLEARVVTFHAGTYPVFADKERALQQLAEKFAPFTKSESPIVTLENMPVRGGTARECLGKLDDLVDLEALLPDIRFTLDVGHCLQNGDDFESFLRQKTSRISDIHLHDGVCGGKAHLALGEGRLDLVSFLHTLDESKFSGYVGLETISWKDTDRSWKSWLDIERHRGSKGRVARAV